MGVILEKNFQLFPLEDFECILKEKIKEEENKSIGVETDHFIKYVIVHLIREGKTDKQIYSQLKFLGRKLKFGSVESLRYSTKKYFIKVDWC